MTATARGDGGATTARARGAGDATGPAGAAARARATTAGVSRTPRAAVTGAVTEAARRGIARGAAATALAAGGEGRTTTRPAAVDAGSSRLSRRAPKPLTGLARAAAVSEARVEG